MQDFVLARDNLRPLAFKGELIGHADTKEGPGGRISPRWTECKIYETGHGLAIEVIGRSSKPGEVDRHWATVAPNARCLADQVDSKFGRLHIAVQTAFQRAGLWEDIAEAKAVPMREIDNGNVANIMHARRAFFVDLREGPTTIFVGKLGPQSPGRLHIVTPPNVGLSIESTEQLVMAMVDCVKVAREMDGDAI